METFSALLAFVRGIHRSPVNSPHKVQWRGALMFSLICPWTNGWVNHRCASVLRTPSGSLWRHCNVLVTSSLTTMYEFQNVSPNPICPCCDIWKYDNIKTNHYQILGYTGHLSWKYSSVKFNHWHKESRIQLNHTVLLVSCGFPTQRFGDAELGWHLGFSSVEI